MSEKLTCPICGLRLRENYGRHNRECKNRHKFKVFKRDGLWILIQCAGVFDAAW